MNGNNSIFCMVKKIDVSTCFLNVFLLFSISFALFALNSIYGTIELFSKDEKPFGISYDDWVSKYWNWDSSLNTDEFTPKPDGCIINKSDSMVMLLNSVVGGSVHQKCTVSFSDGIMIPL